MTATVAAPAQHTTHQRLLHHVAAEDAPQAQLDAIVVPNGRPAAYLKDAFRAARELDATLLLLCSKNARATDAVLAAKRAGVRVRAIDTDEAAGLGAVPPFETNKLLQQQAKRMLRRADTSFKRNLGVLVADLAGWQRILFLDDDIHLSRPGDLRAAAGLLDEYAAVGLANTGMPDNSVVCHAYRDSGGQQDTFVGGGALAVGRDAFSSFFPDIYNEDWFFLLSGTGLRATAVTGTAYQGDYDPYRDTMRARSEELGDTLAEGIYCLLDNGLGIADANAGYWKDFLKSRRAFIRTTLRQVQDAPHLTGAHEDRMVAALKAALGRSLLIEPDLCVGYLRAWQDDREAWHTHLLSLRARHGSASDPDAAFGTLGIAEIVHKS
ncbi:hypothetical protein [Amycolatopsis echigonensis]|uniref:Uncharacterized protein n=1 Tax=Amycolatopsis echigonensis TaxID=2576905 RepID=A0A8E1VVZ8_9PSEU|nr:hypothetical protein [Amycolatopsis echigonensis]MBB2499204.1 hypothetical protein [Amycolatopsis echigonensis]